MGLWDSVRSFFAAAFIGTRAAAPAALALQPRTDFSPGVVGGGYILSKRGDNELMRSFETRPWTHAVVSRRAEMFAPVQWTLHQVKSGARARAVMRRASARLEERNVPIRHRALVDDLVHDGVVEELFDHPLLDLLERPLQATDGLPGLTGIELWELASEYFDMLGASVFLKERAGSRVVGLVPVPPTNLRELPTPKKPTFGFISVSGRERRVPPEDVVWIRRRSLVDPLGGAGVGTARALADDSEIDAYMSATAKARFANQGLPEAILGIEGASDAAIDRFAHELEEKHRGPERAGLIHVLKGKFVAEMLGHTLVESQYVQGRGFGRDAHMQTFGMPPELMGVLANSNKSTIAAAGFHGWRYSTVPKLERFRAVLQADLVEPDFGADLILGYRSMEPEDEEYEKDVMVALPMAATKNEIRKRMGLPPRDDGDVYYTGPGQVPVKGKGGDTPKPKGVDDNKGDPNAVPDA